ncbi:MAG: group I truncated hemoglobin [Saccharofermentanales bacterium]
MEEKTLYERLGGAFAIAAVVDRFSEEIFKNPIAGIHSKNTYLREWHNKQRSRLPGLKFMRTLWFCAASGGPFVYVGTKPGKSSMSLEKAHYDLHISSEEFDAVEGVLAKTLDHFKVQDKEKDDVLAAFAAHKSEVITGFFKSETNE